MRFHILMAGLLVFALGCGDSRIVPVSGRVTLDKKPVPNATVIFQPVSEEINPGPSSQGRTDSNGQFTLLLATGDNKGALIGKHKVRITAYEGEEGKSSSGSDSKFRKRIIPNKYNVESKLTFEVPAGGTTEAIFDLETPPAK